MMAAGSDRLEVLLFQFEVEFLESSVSKRRLSITDSDSRVPFLNDDFLEIINRILAFPVAFDLDITLTAHIKVFVLFPHVCHCDIFKDFGELLN